MRIGFNNDTIEYHSDGTATVTRTSVVSGNRSSLVMPLTQAQYEAWKDGTLIQEAMPQLTPAQREFLMTGISASEWERFFDEGDC
jgi:hypothetical protein